MKHLFRLGSGFLVGMLLLVIITNSVISAFSIFVAAIICTSGISLIVIIPVIYFLGFIINEILFSINKSKNSANEINYNTAIEEFIITSMNNKKNCKYVVDQLMKNGWEKNEIKNVFKNLKTDKWSDEEIDAALS